MIKTPEKMCKVSIAGSKKVLEDTIKIMHERGTVHLVDYAITKSEKEGGVFSIGNSFERADDLSIALVKARSLMRTLGVERVTSATSMQESEKIIEKRIDWLHSVVSGLLDGKEETEEELREIERARDALHFIEMLGIDIDILKETEELSMYKGFVNSNPESVLKSVSKKFELFSEKAGKEVAFVVFIEKEKGNEALAGLKKLEFRDIEFPDNFEKYGTLAKLEKTAKSSELELIDLQTKIARFGRVEGKFLQNSEYNLKRSSEKAEAPLKFAVSDNSFVIEGWIPQRKYSSFANALETELKDKIHVECEEASDESQLSPPTELQNPELINSFEFFVDLYSKPSYKEIDPTNFIFFTFPLFFGFILGDVGYGVITLALFYGAKKILTGKEAHSLLNALMLASLATIIFGFIFGEFFGYEPYHPLLARAHEVNMMLTISVIVGIIHINLGYFLGMLNDYRQKGVGYMIKHTGSWVGFEIAILLVILEIFGKLSFVYSTYLVYGALAASVILLYIGHGIIGIIEIPSVLSNILSYTRLFAVGLASVALAIIVNDFAGAAFVSGGFGYVTGVLILVVGHTINIALGILGGFLQSLRLHYVEFFTKFYKGGGEAYLPFGD